MARVTAEQQPLPRTTAEKPAPRHFEPRRLPAKVYSVAPADYGMCKALSPAIVSAGEDSVEPRLPWHRKVLRGS